MAKEVVYLPRKFQLEALGDVMQQARSALQSVERYGPSVAEHVTDPHAKTMLLMLVKESTTALARFTYADD